jgi:pilus assembly protein CpaB
VKKISPATVTFSVMAIVLGLVAAYIVRQALEKPVVAVRPAPPAPQPEMIPVVFALNVIPKHTRLSPRDVFVSQVPKGTKLPPGVFRGVNLVEGRITKETIGAGKAVRHDMLLGLDEALPDLAERLPPGHRAVTIAVQGADTGGKRLAEGDHIDLAMTVEGTHPDLGEVTTRTLMKNVLIVDAAATGPNVRNARKNQEVESSLITVAVEPLDANKLIVAQRTGILQATLVSAADAAAGAEFVADIQGRDDAVNRRQLLGLKEIVPPKKYTVEKWTGTEVKVFEMSDDRVRESRDVTAGRRREIPVSQPAPALNNSDRDFDRDFDRDLGYEAPSGIRAPGATAINGDAPLALAPAAIPDQAK